MQKTEQAAPVTRVLVGTDRSETADRAVRWAAQFAAGYQAQLFVVQVLVPAKDEGAADGALEARRIEAQTKLEQFARDVAGPRGHARIVLHEDPTEGILQAVNDERADVVVVGNLGMAGRRQFLLGNVPNRISHNARCTVVIVNTMGPGAAPAVTRPAEAPRAGPASPGWEGRLLRRGLHIARVLAGAGLRGGLKTAQPGNEASVRDQAQRFRTALDRLGPTFAKLGQIISTRPDLVPPAFIEELTKLQERVTPLTEAEVVAVMEQELRVPWEDVFATIDPKPLAAGTIAQVHKATLETGERVVAKVQRPNADGAIMLDLGLLERFARKASSRPAFRRVADVPAIIRHLSDSLRRELDFRQEARNIQRMSQVLAPFSRLAVPRVYEEYSTARLLTMEEVQGVPVREAPPGPARAEAARQLLESFYHQVFVEGFFHADPHPGNLKWWNDRIYFLDLGMVGEVEPEVRQLLLMLLLSFSQRDVQFLAEIVLDLAGGGREGTDVDAFREELQGFVTRHRDLSLKEIQLGPMLQEITRVAVRHNVRVPASLALVGKAFAQMQLAAATLDPTLDPFAVAQSFVVRSTVRQFAGSLDPKKLFYEVQKARVRFLRLVEAIERATGARPGGKFQVHFRGTENLERTVSRSIRWLSLALVVASTMVGTAVTAASNTIPWGVPAAIAGGGFMVALALLVDVLRQPAGKA